MDPPLLTPTRQTSDDNHALQYLRASWTCESTSSFFLEEDLVHAKREEEKLKATIEALEREKCEMNARVALMERKDLYKLLEAKMKGFQIANHLGTIGGFENLNLTIMRKWVEIPMFNLESLRNVLGTIMTLLVTLDLTVDACKDLSSLPSSQIVPVLASVDLTQYASSLENEGSEDQGWTRKEDLMKEDLESACYRRRYLWGDVINMYINERFLKKPHKQLHNMFYVNTFRFTKASELVARYDKTNHAKEAMIQITRLWKSICSEIYDEDMQQSFPAWIFVPIHGNNHWSLAIIRIHNDVAMLAHLDSFRGAHDPKAIFHVLRIFLCLTMPNDLALV
ncbi:hypothetical protein R1flu_020730 [Riccia fluitans]|uniref:Ubiquitin-like protease family profile domain-containing protein n=1 Tax=Riccia fluitans TaxID=41844 RepID=A0ABD1ZMT1_9MARC